MKRLSNLSIANSHIENLYLNQNFVIFNSKTLLSNFRLLKKGSIKYILPCIYKNYKKKFKYSYISYEDFSIKRSNILYVYKNFVFKNNKKIFKYNKSINIYMLKIKNLKILFLISFIKYL
jgi:hypothetical protein